MLFSFILTTIILFSTNVFGTSIKKHKSPITKVLYNGLGVGNSTDGGFDLQIYSNNVRYAASVFSRKKYELPWGKRQYGVVDAIVNKLNDNLPILIGLQECLHNQLEDVLHGLNTKTTGSWKYFGVGRDNGKKKGEYTPIIYDESIWEFTNGTYKWLSETPNKPSKFPGAGTKRMVTIGTFKHKQTNQSVNFINTHLDAKSHAARDFGTKLINDYIQQIPNKFPVFLSGDFNSKDNEEAYKTTAKELKDSAFISYKDINSDLRTYSGFGNETGYNIDFIWSPENTNFDSGIYALTHEVVDNLFDVGHRFSDHRPVIVHFTIDILDN
ncbi:hypothetical protein KGF54_004811 [Candida jiufengensis]|uniref:uncharacterized protein n=1 Tax=Candida jiufengensis TaxID=497108 RepID=UPI002224A406|nr:uncharacterized protein KGF54_004811 [Candida jiufengensis]KAI5951736.1 hypothetical protein KGF54_004811 [Candida jiufengensis]